jgi:uncharacterized protein YegL
LSISDKTQLSQIIAAHEEYIQKEGSLKRGLNNNGQDNNEIGRVDSSQRKGHFDGNENNVILQQHDKGSVPEDKEITEKEDNVSSSSPDDGDKEGNYDGNRMGSQSKYTPKRIRSLVVRNDSHERRSDQSLIRFKTNIILLLDESSSMINRKQEVIQGFNDFIQKQKALFPVSEEHEHEDNETTFSLLKFNSLCFWVMLSVPIHGVQELSPTQYTPNGSTALYNAMGLGIEWGDLSKNNQDQDMDMDRVLFVIITDGAENASLLFGKEQIKGMIQERKSRGNWTFAYFGVNPARTALDLGIPLNNTLDYNNNTNPDLSVPQLFTRLSTSTSSYRSRDSVASFSDFVDP